MLATHAIFGAYGFWLPNDPRGSWSKWVGSWELFRYGPATKINTTQSVAHRSHDQQQRLNAKRVLRYEPVVFTGMQARAVGHGFARACQLSGYRILSCAILPDHVHLVVEAHPHSLGQVIGHLKRRSTDRLRQEGLHPFARYADKDESVPTCWARRGWNVFLDTPGDVRRAIRYVRENPVKEGKPQQ